MIWSMINRSCDHMCHHKPIVHGEGMHNVYDDFSGAYAPFRWTPYKVFYKESALSSVCCLST